MDGWSNKATKMTKLMFSTASCCAVVVSVRFEMGAGYGIFIMELGTCKMASEVYDQRV